MDHERWMRQAVELAHRSPHSMSAFAVGAIIVSADDHEIARGYSRDDDPHVHAEESALTKAAGDPRLTSATLYSTLEPCSQRRSSHVTCSQLIIAAGIPRVFIAWREPDLFVNCEGVALLSAAGVDVIEMPELADAARAANAHLGL